MTRPATHLGADTDQVEATIKLFGELIENSRDNYLRSANKKDYYIKINLYSFRKFSIENNGSMFNLAIPDTQ